MRVTAGGPVSRAAILWLILGICLIAAPRPSGAASEAKGNGGGSINSPDVLGGMRFVHFAFSAATTSGLDAGNFRFTIEAPSPPVDVHVVVDCVNIFPLSTTGPGAGAWVAGAVDRVTPEDNPYLIRPGDRLGFYVTDRSQSPDQIHFVREASSCKSLSEFYFSFDISQGNINIRLP